MLLYEKNNVEILKERYKFQGKKSFICNTCSYRNKSRQGYTYIRRRRRLLCMGAMKGIKSAKGCRDNAKVAKEIRKRGMRVAELVNCTQWKLSSDRS